VVNAPPEGHETAAARVPRKLRKQLRAALHNRAAGRTPKGDESLAQLQGMAAFVYMTDPKAGRRLLDAAAKLAPPK
jgi:RNA-directed DNA polymerase